jgi:hypothetical protein
VPSGPAWSPWRIPLHIAVFVIARFPERKITDVFLVVFVVLHASSRFQLREIEVRELAVIRKFVDTKIE